LKRLTFPKSKRLVSNSQFRAVLAHRIRVSDDFLVLYIAKNDCSWPRLGVSVDKSCGCAVARNRLKRLLREVFRRNQNEIAAEYDYLLMISRKWSKKIRDLENPKKAVMDLTYGQVEESFLALSAEAANKVGTK